MGFVPGRIVHIREGPKFMGNASPALIDQVGETLARPRLHSKRFSSFNISMHFDILTTCLRGNP